MKVIIAGSRGITDYREVELAVVDSRLEITTVISGCARGVDMLGLRWAAERKVPIERFPAKWKQHGKGAGFLRNSAMAYAADALIAVWDGQSHGTKHMIDTAREYGLEVLVRNVGEKDQLTMWSPAR